MSMEAVGYVFAFQLPAAEKLLLILLANHADKYGDSVFPALDTLEVETGLSRSTLKRAFKELLRRELIERLAESTPVSPAWYRILGVPEPHEPVKQPTCPHVLRRAVILAFEQTCEYCKKTSDSRDLGPDGKPWHIDRVVAGKRGGIYSPDNVTLACRGCNLKKKANPAPDGTRTFTDLQREGTVQIGPSLSDDQPVHLEPWGDELADARTVHRGRREGVSVDPEPVTESFPDPIPEESRAGAPPRLVPKTTEAEKALPAITKLAHEVFDLLGVKADSVELTESLKSRCATLKIPYDSGVVRKALDSARWQRDHRPSPEVH